MAEANENVLSREDFSKPSNPVSFSGQIISLHRVLYNIVTNADSKCDIPSDPELDLDGNLIGIAIPYGSLRNHSLHFLVLSVVIKRLKERGVRMVKEKRIINNTVENYLVLSVIKE